MRCIVANCDHDPMEITQEISYHRNHKTRRFPTEPSLRVAWLEALHMTSYELEEHSTICSNHFQRKDLLVSSSGQLAVRAGAVPIEDVQVCRICFTTEFRLYSMMTYRTLSEAYETLTGLLLENESNMPPYLCSECARQLLYCTHFRTTSLQAHLTLLDIVKSHGYVTLQLIQSVKGIQGPRSSIQTDRDLDIELNEKEKILYPSEQRSVKPLPSSGDNVSVEIKVEDNVTSQELPNTEDAANNTVCASSVRENIAIVDIKIENEGMINENVYNAEDAAKNVMVYKPSLAEDIVIDGVKVESAGAIDVNIFEGTSKGATVYVSGLPEDDVKTETDSVMNENSATEDSSDFDMDNEDTGGEDYSSDDSLPLAETRQKVKPKQVRRVPNESGKANVDTHSKPDGVTFYNKLPCDKCPYRTNNKLRLESHLKAHAATDCYRCNRCSYITMNKRSLTSHVKIHTGEKMYTCDVCNEAFRRQLHLKKHLRTHSGERPYSCEVCYKVFRYKNNFTKHLKKHSGGKMYSCDICNEVFNNKINHMIHLKTHSGVKSHACDVCKKVFNQKYTLISHMKKVHPNVKSYLCDVCNKEFSDGSDLRDHLITHSDDTATSCDICHKTFNQKGLAVHMRTHSDVQSYSCKVCNKVFKYKTNLTNHMTTHTDENAFSCDVCNEVFSYKINLIIHLRTHSDNTDTRTDGRTASK